MKKYDICILFVVLALSYKTSKSLDKHEHKLSEELITNEFIKLEITRKEWKSGTQQPAYTLQEEMQHLN